MRTHLLNMYKCFSSYLICIVEHMPYPSSEQWISKNSLHKCLINTYVKINTNKENIAKSQSIIVIGSSFIHLITRYTSIFQIGMIYRIKLSEI